MRLPRSVPSGAAFADLDGVQREILQEMAANLGRLGARLTEALGALESFDAEPARGAESAPPRAALVAAAGEALWYLVVQREVCGLHDTEQLLRDFRVPREVWLRMGPARSPRAG